MSFLHIFNNEIHLYVVLLALLAASSVPGVHGEHCNVIDDQGQKDKIYCEIGCCGPLEDSYCCIEDDTSFEEYYYGYKVAGAVVGFIFGLLAAIATGRCIFGICRDRSIFVTTVEPAEDGGISVTTSAEPSEPGGLPMQRPSTISYSEDNYHVYNDEQRLVR